jgi:hypothetical protein
MLRYWTNRAINLLAWPLIGTLLVVIPFAHFGIGFSAPTGIAASPLGTILVELGLVAILISGWLVRVKSQTTSLATLIADRHAAFGFIGNVDLSTSRWLSEQSASQLARSFAPALVYVVVTDAGLEFHWPLGSQYESLIYVLLWSEVVEFSLRHHVFLADQATVSLDQGQSLHISLARISLVASGRAQGERVLSAILPRLSSGRT